MEMMRTLKPWGGDGVRHPCDKNRTRTLVSPSWSVCQGIRPKMRERVSVWAGAECYGEKGRLNRRRGTRNAGMLARHGRQGAILVRGGLKSGWHWAKSWRRWEVNHANIKGRQYQGQWEARRQGVTWRIHFKRIISAARLRTDLGR